MSQGHLYESCNMERFVAQPKRVIGIVGSEAIKFTSETEAKAKEIIRALLRGLNSLGYPSGLNITGYSSGHCHLGGIDIWTEEIGDELGIIKYIFPPKTQSWETGYKPRNLQIVEASTEVHCITVRKLPADYKGMRFDGCYHCHTKDHVKSGGCWTALHAKKKGKPAFWHVI